MQHSLENFKCHGCNERFDHYSTEVQFVTIPTLENGISYKRHFCLKCVNTKSSHPIPRFNYPSLPNQPVFGVHEVDRIPKPEMNRVPEMNMHFLAAASQQVQERHQVQERQQIHLQSMTPPISMVINEVVGQVNQVNNQNQNQNQNQNNHQNQNNQNPPQQQQINNPNIHKCHLCHRSFDKADKLKKHNKRVHEETKIKDHKCEFCGKFYGSQQVLNRHVNSVHRGIKEFQCKLCDKSYTQSHSLKYHIKIVHEGMKAEKRYKCDSCDKAFTQSHSLKDHIKRGHGVKAYGC